MDADRAELLAQIRSARADLDRLLVQLGSDADSLLAEAHGQRELLGQLERSLSSGTAAPLGTLRSEVAGAIAATTNLSQQVRLANEQRANVDLATAQARARAAVTEIGRDIYERRIFDPYLRFASAEEEEAYRRREEENRRAIADALAENTPEGDLRAARLIRRQLADAGAHGADASPEFAGRMARINSDIADLERAAGSRQNDQPGSHQGISATPASPQSPPPASEDQLASVLATFRAVGVAGGLPAEQSGHGLSIDRSGGGRSQIVPT